MRADASRRGRHTDLVVPDSVASPQNTRVCSRTDCRKPSQRSIAPGCYRDNERRCTQEHLSPCHGVVARSDWLSHPHDRCGAAVSVRGHYLTALLGKHIKVGGQALPLEPPSRSPDGESTRCCPSCHCPTDSEHRAPQWVSPHRGTDDVVKQSLHSCQSSLHLDTDVGSHFRCHMAIS